MNSYAIMSNRMLQVGDQFDHYQIEAHMAQGGMSDIYKAFDLLNRREVVIKIPDHAMAGDPAHFERFQRELAVMKTLNHPAILKGLDSGKYNRLPFLVTEFVDGQSLRTLLETSAPLPPQQAIDLVRKIADGMAYCHANNVIHRDLKPENILITEEGQPVIMDFGLALTKGAHRVTYSNLSATMGTPDYMAPEQIDGQRGDARTDVYALGTILYEALAGRTPFVGDNQMAVMAQHLHNIPQRLDRLNPEVSPQLAALIAKSLARDPADRYQDMNAFIAALDHPDQAELSILETAANPATTGSSSSVRAQFFRVIGIAFAILAGIVILAVVLQSLR